MPKDHLDHLDRDATGEQHRAGPVSGVVQTDHRQTALTHVGLELLRDAGGLQRVAVDAAENQVMVAVVRAEVRAFLLLRSAVPAQWSDGSCRWSPAMGRDDVPVLP